MKIDNKNFLVTLLVVRSVFPRLLHCQMASGTVLKLNNYRFGKSTKLSAKFNWNKILIQLRKAISNPFLHVVSITNIFRLKLFGNQAEGFTCRSPQVSLECYSLTHSHPSLISNSKRCVLRTKKLSSFSSHLFHELQGTLSKFNLFKASIINVFFVMKLSSS